MTLRAVVPLLCLSPMMAAAQTDCTAVGNDVARYVQDVVQAMRGATPPELAVGARIKIAISQTDPGNAGALGETWTEGAGLDPTNFYFTEIKEILSRSFTTYDMNGGPGRESTLGVAWSYEVGAPSEAAAAPITHDTIGRNFAARSFSQGDACHVAVEVTNTWLVAQATASLEGTVMRRSKDGTEPLPDGALAFTRLGPNTGESGNGATTIREGAYKSDPELAAGHYQVRLTAPKACAQDLETNWVYEPGITAAKSWEIECDPKCLWDVTVRGTYKVCSELGGGCTTETGMATWPSMPIAIDPDVDCHADVPRLIDGEDAPFDLMALNPESSVITEGDFILDDALWINIGRVVGKGGGAAPAQFAASPILIDFHAHSAETKKRTEAYKSATKSELPWGISATHQCFVPGGFWGQCVFKDMEKRLKEREEISIKLRQSDPMRGRETGDFVITLTPVE